MGGRLIFRGLHGCSPIRLYCHWSGKLANTLGDLDKYLFSFFGYESFHTIVPQFEVSVSNVVEFPEAGLGSRAKTEFATKTVQASNFRLN